jgi:hypothetical protein
MKNSEFFPATRKYQDFQMLNEKYNAGSKITGDRKVSFKVVEPVWKALHNCTRGSQLYAILTAAVEETAFFCPRAEGITVRAYDDHRISVFAHYPNGDTYKMVEFTVNEHGAGSIARISKIEGCF